MRLGNYTPKLSLSEDDIKRIHARKGPKNWKQEGWKAPTAARFMLKSFAREFVRIKGVRIERLQDITPEDCVAEGVTHPLGNLPQSMGWVRSRMEKELLESFQKLWNSIHGPDAWDRNDWVWVYEFERMEVKP